MKISKKQLRALLALPFMAIFVMVAVAGPALATSTVAGTLAITDSNNLPVEGGVTIYVQDSQYWGLYKHTGLFVQATTSDAGGLAYYSGLTAGASYVAVITGISGHTYSQSFIAVNATTPIQTSSTDWVRANLMPIGVGAGALFIGLLAIGWLRRDKINDAIKV